MKDQSSRRNLLDGHLLLLRLAEQMPEIPLNRRVRLVLPGGDTVGLSQLDQLAAALNARSVPFTDVADEHDRTITFTTGAVTTEVIHVYDHVMQGHELRNSYASNVQVDVTPVGV